jgi:hypothetical protein
MAIHRNNSTLASQGTAIAKGDKTSPSYTPESWSLSSPFSNPTDLTNDYITKSKAAVARWSGSERKMAKAKQEALNEARREKSAVLRVFGLSSTSGAEGARENSEYEEGDSREEQLMGEEHVESNYSRERFSEEELTGDEWTEEEWTQESYHGMDYHKDRDGFAGKDE